jgi:hypothetical protein
MALFVEVDSIERGCQVIINIDHILEIAPLKNGGCTLFMIDSASTAGKTSMRVKDSYDMFKQFAMQTVSSDMIQDRIQKINAKVPADMKPVTKRKTMDESFDIPKL